MRVEPHEIHIWHTDLTLNDAEEKELRSLLSEDEQARADRFHFPLHRKRFIAARSLLRKIIACYIPGLDPIKFVYNEHQKPSLATSHHPSLQFNLAHSENVALFAFTKEAEIGIDIEKIKEKNQEELAKRFFNPHEVASLMTLAPKERVTAFYRLWVRKEALIKAIGKGLSMSLSSFEVSIKPGLETVSIHQQNWSLVSFDLYPHYQSALATNQTIKKMAFWTLQDDHPHLENETVF